MANLLETYNKKMQERGYTLDTNGKYTKTGNNYTVGGNSGRNTYTSASNKTKSAYQKMLSDEDEEEEEEERERVRSSKRMTNQEVVSKIYEMSKTDKEAANNALSMYRQLQNDPTSAYYNPYRNSTNSALTTLSELGADVSKIDDDWIEGYSWLKEHYLFNGTSNTPSKPGKNASVEEIAAYNYYQVLKSEGQTRKAEQEWAALQEEIKYWTNRSDRNYSDDEILGKINWNNYKTLTAMDESAAQGTPLELNRGIGYSRDNLYGVIWQARNGRSSGSLELDSAMNYTGEGNRWKEDRNISERLDPNSGRFNPYTVGSTLEQEGLYFGQNSFDQSWIDGNREFSYGSDKNSQQNFRNVVEAERTTQAAEKELANVREKMTSLISNSKSPEDAKLKLEEYINSNCPTLKKMNDSLTDGKLLNTTRAIDFDLNDLKAEIDTGVLEQKEKEEAGERELDETVAAGKTSEPAIGPKQVERFTDEQLHLDMNDEDALEAFRQEKGQTGSQTSPDRTAQSTAENAAASLTEEESAFMRERRRAKNNAYRQSADILGDEKTAAEENMYERGNVINFGDTVNRIRGMIDQASDYVSYAFGKYTSRASTNFFNTTLKTHQEITDYEAQKSNLEALQLRSDELASKLGDKVYAVGDSAPYSMRTTMDINGRDLEVLMERSTDGSGFVIRQYHDPETGDYYNPNGGGTLSEEDFFAQYDRELVNSKVDASLAGANEFYQKKLDAFLNAPALTEEDQRDLEELQNLSGRIQEAQSYMKEHQTAYDEATEAMTKATKAYDDSVFVLNLFGGDTSTLAKNKAIADFVTSFDKYEGTQWAAYNSYNLLQDMYIESNDFDPETGTFGGNSLANAQAVWKAAKEGGDKNNGYVVTVDGTDFVLSNGKDELTEMLADVSFARDYLAEHPEIEVPENYLTNLDRFAGKIEREIKGYDYFLLTANDDYTAKVDEGRELDKQNKGVDWANFDINVVSGDMMGSLDSLPNSNYMTVMEREAYYYLLAKEGKESAMEFYNYLADEQYGVLPVRFTEDVQGFGSDWAKEGLGGFVMSNAVAIASAPVRFLGSGLWYLNSAISGQELNPNSALLAFNNFTTATREASREAIDEQWEPGSLANKVANIGYEIATNRGDSVMMAGVFGNLIPGFDKLAEPVQEFLSALPMGVSAAGDAGAEVKRKGGSDEQAWAIGGITAITEAATEAISLSDIEDARLLGVDITGKSVKDFLVNWVTKAGLSEAFGESLNDVIENTADELIMGELSDHSERVDTYMKTYGMGYDEANAAARRDEMMGVLHTALVSYISPGADFIQYASGRFAGYYAKANELQKIGYDVSIRDVRKQAESVRKNAQNDTHESGEINYDALPALQESIRQFEAEQAATSAKSDRKNGTSAEGAGALQDAGAEQAAQDIAGNIRNLADASAVQRKNRNERTIVEQEMLASAAGHDRTAQTEAVAGVFGGISEEQREESNAAAMNLGNVYGKHANVASETQRLLVGAMLGGSDGDVVKLGLKYAALAGENSAVYQAMQSPAYQEGDQATQARIVEQAALQDMESDSVAEAAAKTVHDYRVAEVEKQLIADGALDSVNAAQAEADNAKSDTAKAAEALEQRNAEVDAANEALEAANSEFINDSGDHAKADQLVHAANEQKKAVAVQQEYQQSHDNAQERQTIAENKLEQTKGEATATLREQAETIVAQQDQKRAETRAEEEQQAEEERIEAERQQAESNEIGNVNKMDADTFIEQRYPNATEEEKERIRQSIDRVAAERSTDANLRRGKFVKQISKKFGVNIEVVDTTSGGRVARQNGYYVSGSNRIVLDQQSTVDDAMYFVLAHELTHVAEASDTYKDLANALLHGRYGQDVDYQGVLTALKNGDISTQLAADVMARKEMYDNRLALMHEQDSSIDATPLSYEDALQEIVADETGRLLKGDMELANRLAAEEPSTLRRIIESIKNFLKKVTGMQGEWVTDAQRTVDMLEAALKNAQEKRAEQNDGRTQYSVNEAQTVVEGDNGNALVSELPGGTIASDMSYSLNTWTDAEKDRVRDSLLEKGFTEEQVNNWIQNTNSIAAEIAKDRDRLDFVASDNQVFLKKNNDYIYTLDASTLCAKRLLYQGTFNYVQHALPDEVFTPSDLIDLVNIMARQGYETPCGICYVESRRRWLDTYAQQFIENLPDDADGFVNAYFKKSSKEEKDAIRERFTGIKPSVDDLTTTDGLETLRHDNPDMYKAFVYAMNQKGSANPKVVQLRTEYRSEISRMSDNDIQAVKDIGGLRIQSFSDFETPHLLDMVQAVMDMSAKGLTSQAYTKVPNFAWVFGDTGIKINLSLIGKGKGLDENGNLVFDNREGMNFDEAMKLRERYSQNVGTILVGINDDHIIAAMGDPRIDFIIPFHKSGWSEKELSGIPTLKNYEDYTDYQNERLIVGERTNKTIYAKKNAGQKAVNNWIASEGEKHPGYVVTEVSPGKYDITYKSGYQTESFASEAKRLGIPESKMRKNFEPVGANKYWEFDKSGEWNSRKYLRMCAEDGRIPKFSQFLVDNGDGSFSLPEGNDKRSTAIREGYWKTLIDFKMYDNEGNGAEQKTVTPNINMAQAERVLGEYSLDRQMPAREDGTPGEIVHMKDNNSVPVATSAAEEFIELIKRRREVPKPTTPPDSLEAPLPISVDSLPKRSSGSQDNTGVRNNATIFGATEAPATLGNKPSGQAEYAGSTKSAMAIDSETGETEKRSYSLPEEYPLPSDAPYLAAVERGEMENAKQMVDEAAEKAGYTTKAYMTEDYSQNSARYSLPEIYAEYDEALAEGNEDWQKQLVMQAALENGYTTGAYHGSNVTDISEFNTRSDETKKQKLQLLFGTHFTQNRSYAELYAKKAKNSKGTSRMTTRTGKVYDVVLDLGKSLDLRTAQNYTPDTEMYQLYNDLPTNIKKKHKPYTFTAYDTEIGLGSGNFITARQIEDSLDDMSPKDATEFLVNHGYNSVLYDANYGTAMAYNAFSRDPSIIMLDSEKIKSADPVTYDENGNVIPLSERFNREERNINYALPSDEYLDGQIRQYLDNGGAPSVEAQQPATQTVPQRQFGNTRAHNASGLSEEIKDWLYNHSDRDVDTNDAQVNRAVAWMTSNRSDIDPEGFWTSLEEIDSPSFNPLSADGQARMFVLASAAAARNNTAAQQKILNAINVSGTDIARALQVRKLYRLLTPEGRMSVLQAEVDRINTELKNQGKDGNVTLDHFILQAAASAQSEEDFEKAKKAMQESLAAQVPATWKDKLQTWRMISMLANPRTHVRNFVGNGLFVPVVGLKNAIGQGLESVSERTGVFGYDLGERTKSAGRHSEEARTFAEQDAKTMQSILTGEEKYRQEDKIKQNIKAFGRGNGLLSRTIGRGVQAVADFNSNMLEREDAVFLNYHYRNALASYMDANGLAAADMTGDTLTAARNYAVIEAQKATYRDANETSSWLNQKSRQGGFSGWLVDTILPFKKTPANILRRGVEYSPAGLLYSIATAKNSLDKYAAWEANGKKGNMPKGAKTATQVLDGIASGLAGTAIAGIGAFLKSIGAVRLSFNDDDDRDQLDKANGAQEYSVELFGHSVTVDWAAPVSMPFFVGASLYENIKENDGEFSIASFLSSMSRITEPVFNLSMLDGVNSLLSTVMYNRKSLPTDAILLKIGANYVGSILGPSVFGAVARTVDTTKRRNYAESGDQMKEWTQMFEQVQNKYPFLSRSNTPYRNMWGEEEKQGYFEAFLENFILPGYHNTLVQDDVSNELARVYEATGGDANVALSAASKKLGDQKLNDVEQDKYAAIRGQTAHSLLQDLFSRQEYNVLGNTNPEAQASLISEVYNYATAAARKSVQPEYKLEGWFKKAYGQEDPLQYLFEREEEKAATAARKEYKSGLFRGINDGDADAILTNLEGWKQSGKKDSEIRSELTKEYKASYIDAVLAGEDERAEDIKSGLLILDLGKSSYEEKDFESWIASWEKENGR